jgi:hypothetical protein
MVRAANAKATALPKRGAETEAVMGVHRRPLVVAATSFCRGLLVVSEAMRFRPPSGSSPLPYVVVALYVPRCLPARWCMPQLRCGDTRLR